MEVCGWVKISLRIFLWKIALNQYCCFGVVYHVYYVYIIILHCYKLLVIMI